MLVACASAKPGIVTPLAPVAYSAPLIAAAAPYVSATSSQVVHRQYNGLAAAPLIAAAPAAYTAAAYTGLVSPYAAAYTSAAYPYAASPYVASPYVASPYVASPYVASPYVASPYASPLKYTAAGPVLL